MQINHGTSRTLYVVKVEVTLRLMVSQSVSQSVCLGIENPCGTCGQILLPVGVLPSEICGLISVRRPLWREDGSAICSVITQWSESHRTRNHTLLSHLRLPQPGGPVSCIYIPRNRVAQLYPQTLGSLYDSPLIAYILWRYVLPIASVTVICTVDASQRFAADCSKFPHWTNLLSSRGQLANDY
jgi:hypothetical protein